MQFCLILSDSVVMLNKAREGGRKAEAEAEAMRVRGITEYDEGEHGVSEKYRSMQILSHHSRINSTHTHTHTARCN